MSWPFTTEGVGVVRLQAVGVVRLQDVGVVRLHGRGCGCRSP